MNKFILGFYFVFLLSNFLFAEETELYDKRNLKNKGFPISLNGIEVNNIESSEKVITKEVLEYLHKFEKSGPIAYFPIFNSKKTEILELVHHPGNHKYGFSELRVYQYNGSSHENILTTFKYTDTFVTDNNIKLGMTQKEVVKLLGSNYKSSKMHQYNKLLYTVKNEKYNIYYMELIFVNEVLTEFSFGFNYL